MIVRAVDVERIALANRQLWVYRLYEVYETVSIFYSFDHQSVVSKRSNPVSCPAARLEILPGLGHFGPLQDPDAVAASVLSFFASA